jgi:peroxiredoxin
MKTFIKIAVLLVVFFVISKSCGPFLGGRNPLIGQLAPDFTLETLSGQEKNMAQFRNGQSAVIFFWATWCPHCRTQLRGLTQQREEIEGKRIKIILVDVGESLREVEAYINAYNISFDVFLDQDALLADGYKIVGVPTFFFVDREGVVIDVQHSLPDNYEEILLGLRP